MKKTTFILIAICYGLFISNNAIAQKPTNELTFTGQEETTSVYVPLDSIFIRNITKAVDTMLTGNDTTLILNLITGINEGLQIAEPFKLQQNYPNPFRDRTTFVISVFQREELNISLFDIYGQMIAGIKGTYGSGTHLFTLTGSQSKFYVLNVTGQSHSSSIKLVNSHPTGSSNHSIVYAGNQPLDAYYKVVMSKDGFPFSYGDELLFVGYAEGYEFSILNDSPEVSTDYTFPFGFVDTFVCGEPYTDERDGQVYQTIKIDRQCWMTENMKIGEMIAGSESQQDNDEFEKYCYDDNEDNCNDFGGLYQWDEMMQYDTDASNQGICPEGWHLPTDDEWNSLIDYYGGSSMAGDSLKSGGYSGFDALMAGFRNISGNFSMLNDEAYFWTTADEDNNFAYYNSLSQSNASVNFGNIDKQMGYSVRCLKGLPVKMDINVVAIDSTVYILISDSLELLQGIYKYEYNGKVKSDEIIVGNTIIGTTDKGYLRKVNAISDDPPILTLETTQATMEDVFVQGNFSTPFTLDSLQPAKKVFGKGTINYLKDGMGLDAKGDGFEYSFDNVEIFDNGNISLYITNGGILYDPEFEFDFQFEDGVVRRLAFYTEGAPLENNIDVHLVAQNSGVVNESFILAEYQYIMGFVIDEAPVWVTINLNLTAEINFDTDAAFELNGGYTNSNIISLGMVYENGEWDDIWGLEEENSFHPLSYDGSMNLSETLALIPSVSIELYGVQGPYFNTSLWQQFVFNYVVSELDIDAIMDIGLDADVGADVTIFGYTLDQYNEDMPGFETNIWNMPDEMEMVSGNNQSAEVGQQLSEPIKVKVTDNYGNTFSNIPVHFEVTQGGGSINNEDVMTDANGYAQTYWTMGSTQGENKLLAKVQKADGTNITGSPMEFTATATSGSTLASVTTTTPTDISQTTAVSGGNVTDDGGSTVTARGVCWDVFPNPTIYDSHTTDGSGTGVFISNITSLLPNATYYIRAYATNSEGTAYGGEENFVTVGYEPCPGMPTVTDIDGNTYNTIQIDDQCWMAENLKTTTYKNGTPIPNITENSAWADLTTGAYVWYDNDISWKDSYGALYNWYVTVDANGVCPTGWHVPTNDEWTELTNFIGGTDSPHGNELKSCRQVNSPLGGSCNTSDHPRWNYSGDHWGADNYGFSGLPGGDRSQYGYFDDIGIFGSWWSSTILSVFPYYRKLYNSYGLIHVGHNETEQVGFSIRCLKD